MASRRCLRSIGEDRVRRGATCAGNGGRGCICEITNAMEVEDSCFILSATTRSRGRKDGVGIQQTSAGAQGSYTKYTCYARASQAMQSEFARVARLTRLMNRNGSGVRVLWLSARCRRICAFPVGRGVADWQRHLLFDVWRVRRSRFASHVDPRLSGRSWMSRPVKSEQASRPFVLPNG